MFSIKLNQQKMEKSTKLTLFWALISTKLQKRHLNFFFFLTQYIRLKTRYIDFKSRYIEFTTQYIEFITRYIEFTTRFIDFKSRYIEFTTHQFTTQYIEFITRYIPLTTRCIHCLHDSAHKQDSQLNRSVLITVWRFVKENSVTEPLTK